MARPRVRGANRSLLYPANTTLGWRVIRTISRHEGEAAVDAGTMRRVFDEISGALIGYQLAAEPVRKVDEDLPGLHSSAAISVREMEIVAGTAFRGGQSRTAGMPEELRQLRAAKTSPRTGRRLTTEDAVERATAKVVNWPLVGANTRFVPLGAR